MCARLPVAFKSIVEGNALAKSGDVAGAAAKYEQAWQTEPSLPQLGTWQAKWLSAQTDAHGARQDSLSRVAEVQALARAGQKEAAAALSEALDSPLQTGLNVNRAADEGRLALAQSYEALAHVAGNAGDKARTRELLTHAQEADPQRRIYIEAETEKLIVGPIVSRAKFAARLGNIDEVLQLRQKLTEQGYTVVALDNDGAYNNDFCWHGSLGPLELAKRADVQKACAAAVAITQEKTSSYLDSRGLNRARNGDMRGAIEDFRAFADDSNQPRPLRDSRLQWIKQLEEGRDPFTPDELKKLR